MSDLDICKNKCGNNGSCGAQCEREFFENIDNCPCNKNCPNGCPCPKYDCDSGSRTSVLMLNTRHAPVNPPAIITDLNGKFDTSHSLYIKEDSVVTHSCGITFQGDFYVYGGYVPNSGDQSTTYQISKIENCVLKRVGTLPFNQNFAGCTTTRGQIFICFGHSTDYKTCHKSTNPEKGPWEPTRQSLFQHNAIRIASSDCKLKLDQIDVKYIFR